MVKPKASSTPKIVNISRRRPIGDVNNDSVQSPINSVHVYENMTVNRTSDANLKNMDSIQSSRLSTVSNTHKHENVVGKRSSDVSPSRSSEDNINYSHKHEYTTEKRTFQSNSDDEYDYADSNEETDKTAEERITNTTVCNCVNTSFLLAFVVITVAVLLYFYPEEQKVNATTSVKILSEEFPSQVEDFWLYIEEGIKDVKKFHKPKTFIFLYNREGQETLKNILNRIVDVATCSLTYCAAKPVILKASDLNNPSILKDYGEIITRNKARLEESGVMIIKNLEKVPGVSAQAFHSFCDEYNPVVHTALFIFTMKVDKFYDDNLKFVEKYLQEQWKDIKDDKFYPLFTRIANVVLPVVVEK